MSAIISELNLKKNTNYEIIKRLDEYVRMAL